MALFIFYGPGNEKKSLTRVCVVAFGDVILDFIKMIFKQEYVHSCILYNFKLQSIYSLGLLVFTYKLQTVKCPKSLHQISGPTILHRKRREITG